MIPERMPTLKSLHGGIAAESQWAAFERYWRQAECFSGAFNLATKIYPDESHIELIFDCGQKCARLVDIADCVNRRYTALPLFNEMVRSCSVTAFCMDEAIIARHLVRNGFSI